MKVSTQACFDTKNSAKTPEKSRNLKYGYGGVGGYGTICGVLNGAADAIILK